MPALSMVGLMVEAADVLMPASSMVGLMSSPLTAAPAPQFCACGATTCRASGHGVVGESTLASRASNTLAPSLSPRALTHAAASWPAVPPAPADASWLICDWVSMSPCWVSSGHTPAG